MGVSTSAMPWYKGTSDVTSREWEPTLDPNVPRKVSKAGYDITPMTKEQRDAEAAKADPMTR